MLFFIFHIVQDFLRIAENRFRFQADLMCRYSQLTCCQHLSSSFKTKYETSSYLKWYTACLPNNWCFKTFSCSMLCSFLHIVYLRYNTHLEHGFSSITIMNSFEKITKRKSRNSTKFLIYKSVLTRPLLGFYRDSFLLCGICFVDFSSLINNEYDQINMIST